MGISIIVRPENLIKLAEKAKDPNHVIHTLIDEWVAKDQEVAESVRWLQDRYKELYEVLPQIETNLRKKKGEYCKECSNWRYRKRLATHLVVNFDLTPLDQYCDGCVNLIRDRVVASEPTYKQLKDLNANLQKERNAIWTKFWQEIQ